MLVSQNPLDIIMILSFKERASVGMVRTMDMSVVGIINIVVSRVKSWFVIIGNSESHIVCSGTIYS